jgi:protein tyrosine/serine phosphatase
MTPRALSLFLAFRAVNWLTLDGAVNVRDLGGLPLQGGGSTRAGVLVRADNLQGLSARDVEVLQSLGLKLVVDLRTVEEIELEGPGPLVGRIEHRNRSLHPEDGERTDVYVDDRDEARLVRMYMRYLRDRPDSIVEALRDVAYGEGAAIVHCAAGKDRTGMVVALALSAIGVEREAIVADYAATGERLRAILERLKSSSTYADDLEGVDDDVHVPRPETMHRVLSLVDARHGSPSDWLRSHGFADFDALRVRLT